MKPVSTPPSALFNRAVPFATATLAGVAMLAVCVLPADAQAKPAARAKARMVVDHCSWDKPGLHPFMGDVVAAVDRYQDIPAQVRTRLKARMEDRNFDEFVTIERDTILGQRRYEPGIRDMHFGEGRVCKTVTRTKWSAAERQAGLVYCEGEHCVLVPTVCRNVSRIRRVAGGPAPAPGAPPEEIAGPMPEGGGGYGSAGWLMVQARAAQEPGSIPGGGYGSGIPLVPFAPPYSGGIGGMGDIPLPVPEAPGWLMLGFGALLVAAAGRRFSKKT